MWTAAYEHVAALMPASDDIRQRTLIVRYNALAAMRLKPWRKSFAHFRLEDECSIAARETQSISEQSYYDPGLSVAEVDAIRMETD